MMMNPADFFLQPTPTPGAVFPYHYPQPHPNNNFAFPQYIFQPTPTPPNPFFPNPNFYLQPNLTPPSISSSSGEPVVPSIEGIDSAVGKAWRDLVTAGESVTSWKVSEAALLDLQVDSWASLGFQMHEIPSLNELMLFESKINTFIHCFIAVRQITSLYDLEVAICRNEGVEQFEELELGPLMRHPLVVDYFSLNRDINDIHKISTEEIIILLSAYMDAHRDERIEEIGFMDYLAESQSVSSWEELGIRIQSLGMHVSNIREALRSENSSVKKSLKELNQNFDKLKKKHPTFSTQKNESDKRFDNITQRATSFLITHKDFCGKHIRFASSSSEAEDSDDNRSEEEMEITYKILQQQAHSSCPFPSVNEEMTRLGLKDELGKPISSAGCSSAGTAKKRRKLGSKSHSAPSKSLKMVRRKKSHSSASECKETQAASRPSRSSDDLLGDHLGNVSSEAYPLCSSEVGTTNGSVTKCSSAPPGLGTVGLQPDLAPHQAYSNINAPRDGATVSVAYEGVDTTTSRNSLRSQLDIGNPDGAQVLLTGRLGELLAYKYYSGEAKNMVNWVNEHEETGLPFDIVLGEDENCREYIEVKATKWSRKDWFNITAREWQFALEKGDSFSIAHVILRDDNSATISTFKNPARLCQLGKLQLVLMKPKQQL